VAIGVQNIPEGFAAAAPLLKSDIARIRVAAIALATGLVEPPSALLSLAAFDVASGVLAFGLAFAGGAMLYVVTDELIPESHARGNERAATLALLVGFAFMLVLDNVLG
jgi:ZIP family zinc transporter